jgi:hypothetical protein
MAKNRLVSTLISVKRRLSIGYHARRLIGGLQDLVYDWRCDGWTGGIIESAYQERGARRTESIRYDVLKRLFQQVPISPKDILVDVGCGKGRVIGWWLANDCSNHIIGIELDSRIASKTAMRFAGVQNVEIIVGNVIENFPAEGTLFWLYNPFNERVMAAFADKLKQVCRDEVRLIYAQAKHISVFRDDPSFICEQLSPGWAATGLAYLIRWESRSSAVPVR